MKGGTKGQDLVNSGVNKSLWHLSEADVRISVPVYKFQWPPNKLQAAESSDKMLVHVASSA